MWKMTPRDDCRETFPSSPVSISSPAYIKSSVSRSRLWPFCMSVLSPVAKTTIAAGDSAKRGERLPVAEITVKVREVSAKERCLNMGRFWSELRPRVHSFLGRGSHHSDTVGTESTTGARGFQPVVNVVLVVV